MVRNRSSLLNYFHNMLLIPISIKVQSRVRTVTANLQWDVIPLMGATRDDERRVSGRLRTLSVVTDHHPIPLHGDSRITQSPSVLQTSFHST